MCRRCGNILRDNRSTTSAGISKKSSVRFANVTMCRSMSVMCGIDFLFAHFSFALSGLENPDVSHHPGRCPGSMIHQNPSPERAKQFQPAPTISTRRHEGFEEDARESAIELVFDREGQFA